MNYNKVILFFSMSLLNSAVGIRPSEPTCSTPSSGSKRFASSLPQNAPAQQPTTIINALVAQNTPEKRLKQDEATTQVAKPKTVNCQTLILAPMIRGYFQPKFSIATWPKGTDLQKVAQDRLSLQKEKMRREKETRAKKEEDENRLLGFLNWHAALRQKMARKAAPEKQISTLSIEALPENYTTKHGLILQREINAQSLPVVNSGLLELRSRLKNGSNRLDGWSRPS